MEQKWPEWCHIWLVLISNSYLVQCEKLLESCLLSKTTCAKYSNFSDSFTNIFTFSKYFWFKPLLV